MPTERSLFGDDVLCQGVLLKRIDRSRTRTHYARGGNYRDTPRLRISGVYSTTIPVPILRRLFAMRFSDYKYDQWADHLAHPDAFTINVPRLASNSEETEYFRFFDSLYTMWFRNVADDRTVFDVSKIFTETIPNTTSERFDVSAWRLHLARECGAFLGLLNHSCYAEKTPMSKLYADVMNNTLPPKTRSYGWYVIKRIWLPLWRLTNRWWASSVETKYAPQSIGFLEEMRSMANDGAMPMASFYWYVLRRCWFKPWKITNAWWALAAHRKFAPGGPGYLEDFELEITTTSLHKRARDSFCVDDSESDGSGPSLATRFKRCM